MKDMKLKVLARTAALSGLLTLAGAGAALADDGVISTTGPGSVNTITSNNTSILFESNVNSVTVTNSNTQIGTSGAANVSGNTTGGSATSGTVTNTNNAVTSVSINNGPAVGGLGGGTGTGSGGGNGSGSGAGSGGLGGGSGAASPLGVGGSGSGVGGGVLPSVGCSVVCDVSGLRDLYNPAQATAVDSALKQANGISAGLLALAALLSLVGAGGSAAYAAKRAKA